MLLLSSLHLLLVRLRCRKWLHEMQSHRLGGSGASAGTAPAPTLCCGSQTMLLLSSPRTSHEGPVAHSSGKVQSLCALLHAMLCCTRTASLGLLTGGTTTEFPAMDCWIACMNLLFLLNSCSHLRNDPQQPFPPQPQGYPIAHEKLQCCL